MNRVRTWSVIAAVAFSTLLPARARAGAENAENSISGRILPKIIAQPPPIFPPSLIRSGVDGTVIVAFTVDEEGRVRDPEISSSPDRLLNPYALKAVAAWRFIPGARDGRVTSFRLRAPVDFSAKGETIALGSNTSAPKTTADEIAPALKRQAPPVYPYDMLMQDHSGWADASFVVDYTGRPLFTAPAGSSDRAFALAVVAMVEASAYSPGRKGKAPVMAPLKEHYEFGGEKSLDPEARRVLGELRAHYPAILNSSDLDERPKVIEETPPAYPRALKDAGLTGQAEIEFIIDRDGRVLFPRIVSASHEAFGWAAATAVAQWKFQPPQKAGHRVEAKMSLPIVFTPQKLAELD